MNSTPRPFNNTDIAILCCFVVLVTLQPFFLHGEVIMMETGIHLPALNAMFHGAMPYRDFFYLRGPLELYVPAAMMLLFGKNMIMLPIFYYVGTILTLLVCVFIAKNLYRTRLILYLSIFVLVARTFPRISYNYWGGMRYALGLFSVFLVVNYFKTQKARWIFLAGIVSALSFLTTIEAGASSIIAILGMFIFLYVFGVEDKQMLRRAMGSYLLGFLALVVPFVVYFYFSGALMPFFDAMRAVIFDLNRVFPSEPGVYPETIVKFFFALSPSSRYFKFMTPVFFYAAFLFYMVWRIKRNRFNTEFAALVCLAIYGVVLYMAAFRKIEGHHFEMALQPEKLLYFFIAEETFLLLKAQKKRIHSSLQVAIGQKEVLKRRISVYFINFLFIALVASSVGYSIARFNNRFPAFQLAKNFIFGTHKDLSPLAQEKAVALSLERASGLVVPAWQAEELKGVTDFLRKNTGPQEAIFTFPELGNFNFLADRPFIGRFPIATFSWIEESWKEQLIQQFQKARPRYVIMTKIGHRTFPEVWYFRNPRNKEHFNRVTEFILAHYKPVRTFDSVEIYQLNSNE